MGVFWVLIKQEKGEKIRSLKGLFTPSLFSVYVKTTKELNMLHMAVEETNRTEKAGINRI